MSPLTFDYDAFDETLLAMTDKTIPDPGTDIGQGLEEASRDMDKHSRRKLIVLLTDGEDLEKPAWRGEISGDKWCGGVHDRRGHARWEGNPIRE